MNLPEIIAETAEYFVINKPAGLSIESPSSQPTLLDWMIKEGHITVGEWAESDRYGVVHRLDTETSGVLVWAKNLVAQTRLKQLWQGRQTRKTYLALVVGECEESGEVDLPIARDNKNDRMQVAWLPSAKARPALTTYKQLTVVELGEKKLSLLKLHPITGRTHQIRVHCKAIGHPLVGDKLYGEKASSEAAKILGLNRHFLHAHSLCLPTDNGEAYYEAPLADDLIEALRRFGIETTHLV